MPASSRSSSRSARISRNCAGIGSTSRWKRVVTGVGTYRCSTTIPATPSAAVSQNRPEMPTSPVNAWPTIIASANAKPMLTPMIAIALVRWSSRVRSAVRAITAAPIAPSPCRARPATTPHIVSASAATTLPAAKMSRPALMTRFRPIRSESIPKGIWKMA